MTWYFEEVPAVQLLRAEAQSWWGTPFHQFARSKGPHGGIDCLGFVEECTAAAGLEGFKFERTDHDYSRHVHNDKILNFLRGKTDDARSLTLAARWHEFAIDLTGQGDATFIEPPMIGDLLVYKDSGALGHGVFHMPIMISDTIFMHAAPRIGVAEGQIDDTYYSGHLVAHFRARALDADVVAGIGDAGEGEGATS